MALWQLDQFKPAVMLGFIRDVPEPPGNQRTRWLPNRVVPDLNYEYILGAKQQRVMAHVMAFDSEAPIHGRPGLGEKVEGELPPIKRKARIGEKELIRFYQPRVGTADVQNAIDSVFVTAAELAQTIYSRLEWMSMQALSESSLVYNDSGVQFEMDYGVPEAQQYTFTSGQDGSDTAVPGVTAGSLEDTENFQPLPWLQAIADRVERRTGFRPGEWVLSAKARGLLLTNKSLRALLRGTSQEQSQVVLTMQELNTLFSLYDLPTLYPYDTQVTKENADGTYTDVRAMAENKSFFVPRNLGVGNVLLGPTAESRALFNSSQAANAPGVWASTYATDEPPAEWVKAAAVAFPTLPEAGKISQATLW